MKILLPLFLFAVVTATKAGDIIIINDVKKDVVVNTKFLSDPTEHDGSYDERTVLKDNKESSAGQIVKNRDLTHYWWRDELVATKQQFFY